MPPKRAAPSGGSQAKRSRPSTDAVETAPVGQVAAIPPSKRWAAVSGSGNAEASYKLSMQNPIEAYSFICMCRPPFNDGGDDEEESNGKCDSGKTCLCKKPAADHPDHPWKLTVAGREKFFAQHVHASLRSPGSFGMYTINDHGAYGVLELVQNLILDFEEAAGNYKEQWVVCEALAFFLLTDLAMEISQADDGDTIDDTFRLIGRLFMSMLALLERENLLAKNSEIKNLGLIMALFMKVATEYREFGILEDSSKEALGPKAKKKSWKPHAYPDQIAAYARKYDIPLVGPKHVAALIAQAKAGADLPEPAANTAAADVFGFVKGLKAYKVNCGGITAFLSRRAKKGTTKIGGDALDITTWTSAERKKYAFDKKDPLGKAELDALKRGDVMQPA